MKNLSKIILHNRLFHRIFILDPGLQNLYRVTRTILTVITNIIVVALVFQFIGQKSIVQAPILAAVLGMLPTFAITDPVSKERKKTLFYGCIAALLTLSIGTVVHQWEALEYLFLLIIVFLAFYLRRFGSRFMPLGMIGFIGYYFTFFIPVALSALPYIWLAVIIAFALDYCFMFIFLPQRNKSNLRNLLHSWNIQVTLILQLLLTEKEQEKRKNALQTETVFLTQLSSTLEEQLTYDTIELYGKRLNQQTLRVYFFDSTLAVLTLSKLFRLSLEEKLTHEAEVFLHTVMQKLEKSFASHTWHEKQKLLEKVLDMLEHPPENSNETLSKYFQRMHAQVEWMRYDATEILRGEKQYEKRDGSEPITVSKETWLHPTTSQGIQAVVAVIISILLGFALPLTKPYWVIITSFVVLANANTTGRAYNRAFLRSLGTLLGALVGFGFALLFGSLLVPKVILIFLSIFFAFFFFQVNYALMSFGITIMLAMLYDIMLGGASPNILIARVIDTLLGSLVGVLVSLIVLPKREDTEFKEKMIAYLMQLENIFAQYAARLTEEQKKKSLLKDYFTLTKTQNELQALTTIMIKVPGYDNAYYETIMVIIQSMTFHIAQLFQPRARKTRDEISTETKLLLQKIVVATQENVQYIRKHIQSDEQTKKTKWTDIQLLIDTAKTKPQPLSKNERSRIGVMEHIQVILEKLASAYAIKR